MLQSRSHGRVYIYAPYEEDPHDLTIGHVNSFNDESVGRWSPLSLTLIKSLGWRKQAHDSDEYCFLAELEGTAKA
jgi:hypothetical protein